MNPQLTLEIDKLNPEEKKELLDYLQDSLDKVQYPDMYAELTEAQIKDLKMRIELVEKGEMKFCSWEEVLAYVKDPNRKK